MVPTKAFLGAPDGSAETEGSCVSEVEALRKADCDCDGETVDEGDIKVVGERLTVLLADTVDEGEELAVAELETVLPDASAKLAVKKVFQPCQIEE